ncbi:MAG: hypothetical protein JKY37_14460 [Nannocystaceae bacterium]|nr:hypothetical protein [Nannocystaceae bacterium]
MSMPLLRCTRRAGVVLSLTVVLVACLGAGCGHKEARRLTKASRALGNAIGKGDTQQVRAAIVPGVAPSINLDAMLLGTAKKTWSRALTKPVQASPEAIVFVEPGRPVLAVFTDEGWRFAEDPTDVYAQDTPRRALLALVRASRQQRWDVLLRLAPRRYRTGLSVKDLAVAWTEGEHAAALTEARDHLADRMAGPIIADAHEAALELGDGRFARLEREGDRWVVVDF